MSKKTSKLKQSNEHQCMEILKRVILQIPDTDLQKTLLLGCESLLFADVRTRKFHEFCSLLKLPDLSQKSIDAIVQELNQSFEGAIINVTPCVEDQVLAIDLTYRGEWKFHEEITVKPLEPKDSDEQEIKFKFVPFPIATTGDRDVIWIMAKRETMEIQEAVESMYRVQTEFWNSKAGQKLIRDRVDKSFLEFIQRVPSAALTDVGLKRHYKLPATLAIVKAA